MSGTGRVSPPTAWLVALALVLPIPLPLFAPIMIVEPAGLSGAYEYHYRTDLAKFLKTERGEEYRPKGVMLAMSGGSCATVGPLRLSADGVDMYVVFYPDATQESFYGLVDVLVDGNPDFIVIQDTVVVLIPTPGPSRRARKLYERARLHWTGQLYGLARILGVRQVDVLENDESWRCSPHPRPQSGWAAEVERLMPRISPFSEQRHIEAIEFLGIFSVAGVPVIVASPPTNSYTAEYVSKMHQAASELVCADPTPFDISCRRQSTLIPADKFSDPQHLWPDASELYREWLNNEIIQVLQERSDR